MNNHRRPMRNCSSKFKGVCWRKAGKKWAAQIQLGEQKKHLGSFTDEIEAAEAYNRAALEYFGPDAYLNSFEEIVGLVPGDTQQIPLQNGEFAVVDSIDYEFLTQWNWYFSSDSNPSVRTGGGDNHEFMGCLVLQRKLNQDDIKGANYIDGDTLNNCRDNLRWATASQSGATSKPQKGCSSKFKGVCWHKRRKLWMASIRKDGKSIYLGYFDGEIKAAEAYSRAALELFGEFANINTFEEVVV